jgi:hypothetical protein
MNLSTETLAALATARSELEAETHQTEIPARWETHEYRLLTKLEQFLAHYFDPSFT